MFWNQPFNSRFNTTTVPTTLTEETVNFNGYGLMNANICLTDFNPEDAWAIEYTDFPIPKDHGSAFVSRYFRKKTITAKGNIKGIDKDDAEARLDAFKKYIKGITAPLRYTTQGVTREITATATNISIPRKGYNINVIPFLITWTTTDQYWNAGSQSAIFEAITTNFSEEITCTGNVESWPRVYLGFRTGITGTNTISFTANNRTLTINQTITDSSILLIDCQNKKVEYNGIAIDYTGTFPTFIEDANYFTLNINGTFVVDLTVINKINYL
jgi:hypothetical protein